MSSPPILGRAPSARRTAGWIAASVAALALGAAPGASAAPRSGGGDFDCRASSVRAQLAGQTLLEPVIANPAGTPCADGTASILNPTDIGPVRVDLANADTAIDPNDLSAAPAVDGDNGRAVASVTNPVVDVGGVRLTAGVTGAMASYTCRAGQPVPMGASVVADVLLTVGGQAVPITLPGDNAPFVLDLPGGLGTLLLNQQTIENGRITQRAVELRLPSGSQIANVVIGEAVAGVRGNPCAAAATPPTTPPQCSDARDNDGDGKIDAQDPGCLSGPGGAFNPNDDDETDPSPNPQCSDGRDNDGDGRIDAQDPGCLSGPGGAFNPNDNDEGDAVGLPQCSDGRDNDGDGKNDAQDPGCLSGPGGTFNPNDNDERDLGNSSQCSDGIDNDADGRVDFPADRGCASSTDRTERTPGGTGRLTTVPSRIARAGASGACVRGSFSAVVTGRSISSVRFTLDGRTVRTDGSSPFNARISTSRAGTHRVSARVTFTSDSGTRARTLSFGFRRCASAPRGPRFTG
jgi:hypothetical protein